MGPILPIRWGGIYIWTTDQLSISGYDVKNWTIYTLDFTSLEEVLQHVHTPKTILIVSFYRLINSKQCQTHRQIWTVRVINFKRIA